MDAVLWTGDGTSNRTISTNFNPDFLWIKPRSLAESNSLFDKIRGDGVRLVTNSTSAESNITWAKLISNGFQVDDTTFNNSSATFVGWHWLANGSGLSNTSGSITSTVSANTTAGFSVVTFSNPTTGSTIGHGLGVAPKMMIVKDRGNVSNWQVYHASLGNNANLRLNLTDAQNTPSNLWDTTTPTSTVFTFGSGFAGSYSYVVYCWAEIAGFSKFGSYTGNGSADGPFVYLGFRPKFVIFKDYSNAHSWVMVDSSRNTYNVAGDYLRAESSAAENATYSVANNTAVDFLSNGFKLRNAGVNSGENNGSSNYIYMAFAENPFKNANAR
jgi:hypothetical protein